MQRKGLDEVVFNPPPGASGRRVSICRKAKGLAAGAKELFDGRRGRLLISGLSLR